MASKLSVNPVNVQREEDGWTTTAELKRAAAATDNLMPSIIAAARARATEGEMIAALQEVFGTYTESPVF